MKKNLRYNSICLRVLAFLCLILVGGSSASGQTYYVFQNGTYGYLYNDNGTLKSSTTFQGPSSVWIMPGTISTTSQSIKSYSDQTRYLYIGANNGGTPSLRTTEDSRWQVRDNVLATRTTGWSATSYYFKATNATTFSTASGNNGNRYTPYVVTITDQAASLTAPTISGGTSVMSATGSTTFSHSTSTYTPQRTNYRFNNADHYVNGTSATVSYSWALSDMAGYATVSNAGVVTYSTLIPERERTATLTCTATAGGLTQTATTTIKFVNPNVLYNPSISYDNAAGGKVAVTLSYPESDPDVKLYYTTNGDAPSSSSTEYTGPFEVASPTTIKVIAVKGSTVSGIASAVVENITTGVSDGKVVLDDREDHTWTYYAGVNSDVDGGHYNDTYKALGTGTKFDVKMYSPDPRNVKITYKATQNAQVSISESENTFVYYTTLEQGQTSGQYPYTVISNPFSKRPSSGTGNSKVYYGFAGWKVTSGYEYMRHANGTAVTKDEVLALDESIYFTQLPYPSVNCTSAEIVFETTWTTANRTYITTNPGSGQTYTFNSGTYETNFVVINVNYTRQITISGSATIMMVEPDGSADYRTTRAYSGALVPATGAANTTKIEFANWTNTGNLDGYGRNLTVGRGMKMTTARDAMGSAQTGACDQILKIESGNYGTFYHFTANPSSLTKQWITFGNDYDRAKKDWVGNDNTLNFSGQMRGGANRSIGKRATEEMWRVVAKSGKFLTGVGGPQNAAAEQSYYIGVSGTHNNGYRYLEIQGGYWAGNISGGMGENHTATEPAFTFRMRGGRIAGSVYGAAQYAGAGGTRTYILTGGEINGWVAAGANGTQSDGGQNKGASYVYVGGNAVIDSNHSTTAINRAVGGNVFGAGCGYSATSNSGEMTLGSNMVVADNAYIERGIYGGGAFGFVTNTQTSYIYITGGHVGGYTGQDYGNTTIQGGVYGGARQNKGGSAIIYMTGGLVETGIYGGSNNSGTMAGSVTMQINGGQVGTSTTPANIHGGGFGQLTVVNGSVDITLGKTRAARDADGVLVYGDVYGGSALGQVNATATVGNTALSNIQYKSNTNTNVTMNAGYIHGSLYGGALGSSTVAANVYGPVQVKVYGGSVMNTDGTGANGSGAVYGANNINGAPQRSVTVDIYGTNSAPAEGEYALFSVYGGGNQANYTYGNGYPKVTVHNCDNSIEYVYGGGNAAAVAATDVTIYGGYKIGNVFGGGNGQVRAANVTGGTNVKIYGGTIGDVYGGSNTQGTIGGTINVSVNAQAEGGNPACPIDIDNVYGGGNKAASKVGNVTIGCAEHIGAVYGGANQANVTGDITLNIVSGHIDNVFGGNNNSGNISGNITVNINDNGSACGMLVGNVYGGGNKAAYGHNTNYPVVNILNGHLTGSVFGGGLGETAVVNGNPQVTIGQATGTVTIDGDVYGGGDAGDVNGTPVVTVFNNCNNTVANVYGGGNAADVSGTNVTVNGATIGMVFGGGHGNKDAEPQLEANVNGNVTLTITGGTISKVFAGSNSKGAITGTANLTVNKGAGSCPLHITELYGGGNEAAGNAGTISIQNTGTAEEGIGTVYGGANNADINSDIALNITGGNIGDIFGGNNNGGQVKGNITVDINWTGTGVNHVGNVYGGGNIASIDNGTPRTVTVNIPNATVSGSVFGGGKGKKAVIVGNTYVNLGEWSETTNVTVNGDVFGGGDLAAVEGPCNVTIRDCGTLITGDLYGGGNAAPVFSTNTTMWGGTVMGNVFGGGNGADASKNAKGAQVGYTRDDATAGGSGNATTNIFGGTVGVWSGDNCTAGGGVFGGSNTTGDIKGEVVISVEEKQEGVTGAIPCSPLKFKEIYGAGNLAAYAGTGITFNLGCAKNLEEVYGGAKQADLNSNITLNITSGKIKKVFGGNNISGKLNGTITVQVDETGCFPVEIDNLYLGGNQAAYSVFGYEDNGTPKTSGDAKADPVLNIVSCTNIGRVFGGGLGETATIVGNPVVNVNLIPGDHSAAIAGKTGTIGTIFGGGDAAPVQGNTTINIGKEATAKHITGVDQTTDHAVTNAISGDVFGGGLGATAIVHGSTTVKIQGDTNVEGNVYGGGNAAEVEGTTNVQIGEECP